MLLACLCPMAKIFEKKYQSQLMANPSLVYDENFQFDIVIPRSIGDFKFRYGKPTIQKEPHCLWWLTGGPSGDEVQETDYSGLVQLDVGMDAVSELLSMSVGEKAPQDIEQQLAKAREDAAVRSKARTMRAIKRVHTLLKKQYQENEEQKLGMYEPSPVEFLCAYVLASEESQNAERRKEVTDSFRELLKKTSIH